MGHSVWDAPEFFELTTYLTLYLIPELPAGLKDWNVEKEKEKEEAESSKS